MRAPLVALFAVGILQAPEARRTEARPTEAHRTEAHPTEAHRTEDRAGFVTVLGRDTVALESFIRTDKRLEGDILIRVPGTVHFHYVLEFRDSTTVSRSRLDVRPLGIPAMAPHRVTLDFVRDSVRVTVDSAGETRRTTRGAPKGAPVLFTTGIGSSFGLYASLGMYELALSRLGMRAGDTVPVVSVGAATGRSAHRRFLRRSSQQVDVDYFRMAWTHLTLDDGGRITAADAIETTEQTKSTRTGFIDVPGAAKTFAARDRAGKGIGVASPDDSVRARLGMTSISIDYDSPRRRERSILGSVVPYGKVWRTGANEATILRVDRAITVGGKKVPAGSYSLWTLPSKEGVTLIINRAFGQWGTEYDEGKDLVRVPMRVAAASAPRDNFTISVDARDSVGELRISWDTFVWSVPIDAKQE